MMNRKNIVKASKIILENRLNKTQISKLPKICEPNNYEDAYAIQNELTKSYISFKDNNIIGKKVGCTNNQAQKQLDINVPFYGNLFSKFSSISNCVINSSDFTNPFFEPEFSFKINQDIDISKFPFNTNETNSYIKWSFININIPINFKRKFWFKKRICKI